MPSSGFPMGLLSGHGTAQSKLDAPPEIGKHLADMRRELEAI